MTYLQFHFVFILPVVGVLLFCLRGSTRAEWRELGLGIGFVIVMALFYTTPWDNYLVYKGVWSYPPERVLFTIGYVPIEEYLFFVLMTILTGLWTHLCLKPATGARELANRSVGPRWGGAAFWLALAACGVAMLFDNSTFYMGLILGWAAPVLALHWAFAGDQLWRHFSLWLKAVVPVTVYLAGTDIFAIQNGIWSINVEHTTGLKIFSLPIEEGLFFLIANILVVQGAWTFWLARSLKSR